MTLSPALTLERDGEVMYNLFARVEEGRDGPPYATPGGAQFDWGMSLGGPVRFDLPKVDSGEYRVCSHYSLVGDKPEADRGETCADLIVGE